AFDRPVFIRSICSLSLAALPLSAKVAVPLLLSEFCHQSAAVPLAHLVARCPRRSADRRQRHSGGGAPQNGWLWTHPFLPATVSGCDGGVCPYDCCAGDYWHRVRGAGRHGAAGCQKTGGVLERQPSWLCCAGHLLAAIGRAAR